jgi:hypothetical protein
MNIWEKPKHDCHHAMSIFDVRKKPQMRVANFENQAISLFSLFFENSMSE